MYSLLIFYAHFAAVEFIYSYKYTRALWYTSYANIPDCILPPRSEACWKKRATTGNWVCYVLHLFPLLRVSWLYYCSIVLRSLHVSRCLLSTGFICSNLSILSTLSTSCRLANWSFPRVRVQYAI